MHVRTYGIHAVPAPKVFSLNRRTFISRLIATLYSRRDERRPAGAPFCGAIPSVLKPAVPRNERYASDSKPFVNRSGK